MHCTRKLTDNLIWVGANDRRLSMFEGIYSVPHGVSYNAYLLLDEKTLLFDTVDKAVSDRFIENLTHSLAGRDLDYLVVLHMEPDHSACIKELIQRYPNMQLVCTAKTLTFIGQFFDIDVHDRTIIVSEGDTLRTGKHHFHFLTAPMVHWPEVMVAYDETNKILFSADAFGTFGALNGALFADEVDFTLEYMEEARRYYTNIVGKYGPQVVSLLNKAKTLDIQMICPLHGFVWRKDLDVFITKYEHWASYTPEEKGVMIAYASIYGNTENAAEILACALGAAGIKTKMFDVSVTPASEIISAAFRYSHLVFASPTYNNGIFVAMEALLHDLTAHNIQNRTLAFIENGTWAATSGKLMKQLFDSSKNMTILEPMLSLKSSLKENQLDDLTQMAKAIIATI